MIAFLIVLALCTPCAFCCFLIAVCEVRRAFRRPRVMDEGMVRVVQRPRSGNVESIAFVRRGEHR